MDESKDEELNLSKGRIGFALKELLMRCRLENDLKHGTMPLNTEKPKFYSLGIRNSPRRGNLLTMMW